MTQPSPDRGRWEDVAPYVRELLDGLPDHIWFMSSDLSTVLYSTKSFESIYGMTLDELYADPSSPIALGHPDDTGEIVRALEQGRPSARPREFVIRLTARDGDQRVIRLRTAPIFDDAGDLEMVAGVTEDITESVADREEIEHLNRLLTTVLDSTTDAIALVDRDDRIRYINPRLRALAQVTDDDVVGRPVDEVLPHRSDLLREATAEVFADGRPRTIAWHQPVIDRWLETTLSPADDDVLVVTEDRTEQRLAEARERRWAEVANRADRLDALGRMAGGIAHDVGNLMRLALSGLADATSATDVDGRRAGLDDATRSVERALAITHQLLVFSRGTEQDPRPTNLDRVIAEMSTLIERTMGSHIEVSIQLDAAGTHVMSDPHRLEQLILNLATNAGRAMPDGGRFTISTERIAPLTEPGPVIGNGEASPIGTHVRLEAADTGRGMTPDVADRAFEPFFTTDELHGSGLGLPTVYGTAVAAGGSADLETAPGAGTRVIIRLPVVDTDQHRTPTVLLVDTFEPESDETLQALTAAGFTINRLTPARVVAEVERHRYDVVVIDPIADGASGPALVQQLRHRCPDLPVVLMSGRTSHAHFAEDDGVRFVPPPYGKRELAQVIEEVTAR